MKENVGDRFAPLGDNLLIEKLQTKGEEKKSPGGIVLPAKNVRPQNTTTVLAVGPEVQGRVKVGDTVVVGTFSGSDVVIGDQECIVINIKDVLGIYK